mgnify:CR=1 FL=1
MKGADYRIDNVYDAEPNSELWDNVFTKNFEKRVQARTVYVWVVNDKENSERLEINKG